MAENNATKSLGTTPIREHDVTFWNFEANDVVLGLSATGASAAIAATEAGASADYTRFQRARS